MMLEYNVALCGRGLTSMLSPYPVPKPWVVGRFLASPTATSELAGVDNFSSEYFDPRGLSIYSSTIPPFRVNYLVQYHMYTLPTMITANFLLPLALSAIAAGALTLDNTLPTVDLGYGVYRATYYNVSTPSPSPLLLVWSVYTNNLRPCRRATTPTYSLTSASPDRPSVSSVSGPRNRHSSTEARSMTAAKDSSVTPPGQVTPFCLHSTTPHRVKTVCSLMLLFHGPCSTVMSGKCRFSFGTYSVLQGVTKERRIFSEANFILRTGYSAEHIQWDLKTPWATQSRS